MNFDKARRDYAADQFKYEYDPTINQLNRYRSIVSGGLPVDVTGTRFDLIQEPKMSLTYGGRDYFSTCKVENSEKMRCITPKVTRIFDNILIF